MTIKQTTGQEAGQTRPSIHESDEELALTNTLDASTNAIAPEVNSRTPTLPVEGRRKHYQAGDSKSLYARDTVPGCRAGDATSAGWLKTGAASAASVGVWTRSGLVVDSKADGSLVANTAATVVRSGTL